MNSADTSNSGEGVNRPFSSSEARKERSARNDSAVITSNAFLRSPSGRIGFIDRPCSAPKNSAAPKTAVANTQEIEIRALRTFIGGKEPAIDTVSCGLSPYPQWNAGTL